ncbi:hypothetical protein EV356DRAFT_510975 [Viridothelium virens]|uniref:AA1-like domain-containing protein n=1 Tax=Viridothelium virens TaxID=1048519 RepID=A0A6A6GU78_VIRVR|nr:hypothetical protein EV356DRAFT_510975 [Viridothelium virens]
MLSQILIAATALTGALAAPSLALRQTSTPKPPYTNTLWSISNFAISGNEGNFFNLTVTDGNATVPATFTVQCTQQTLGGVSFQNVTCAEKDSVGDGDVWFSYDYYAGGVLSILHAYKSGFGQLDPYDFFSASIVDNGEQRDFTLQAEFKGVASA